MANMSIQYDPFVFNVQSQRSKQIDQYHAQSTNYRFERYGKISTDQIRLKVLDIDSLPLCLSNFDVILSIRVMITIIRRP